MNRINLYEQNSLLQNRERIQTALKQYPNVVSVGVGLKETGHRLTSTLCYRVYVQEKKNRSVLQEQEIIPAVIEGYITDIIPYGIVDTCAFDNELYRPLKGGIQIKQDLFGSGNRGIGTLGCLATLNDGSGKIVGLTNEHVLRTHSLEGADGNEVGQPWKVVCCCCCTKNIIGKVLNSSENPDCAIIELHDDIIAEIQAGNTLHEIQEIGTFKGKVKVAVGEHVKKRGAGSFLTHGIVKDIRFDGENLLIAPVDGEDEFATYGDSGSIVLTEDNRVVGLLWGTKRDRFKGDGSSEPNKPPIDIEEKLPSRTHGVAVPIDKVEEELDIIVATQEPIGVTINVHPDDTKTHLIPSVLPPEKNPKQHFVTAKGEGDIVLKAIFDEPIAKERVRWESDNLFAFADPSDPFVVTLTRTGAKGSRTELTLFAHGYEVKKVVVWVVWSVGTSSPASAELKVEPGPTSTRLYQLESFTFDIEPASIIPNDIAVDDVPDLRGPNLTPPPNVDASDTLVYNQGADLSGGAAGKWDTSRQMRIKINNLNGVILPPGKYSQTFINYPSSLLVGNDDVASFIFESNPYDPTFKGKIRIVTEVIYELPHNQADPHGSELEFRIHHKVFARMELNGQWYLISDHKPFRAHFKLVLLDELVQPRTDYNHDGDLLDRVWVNNGSEGKLNNDGF